MREAYGFKDYGATSLIDAPSEVLHRTKYRGVAKKVDPRHHCLALKQGVLFAAVHVHTVEERRLFNKLMGDPTVARTKGDRQWRVNGGEMVRFCERGYGFL